MTSRKNEKNVQDQPADEEMPPLEDIDDELIEEPQINEEEDDGFILAKKSNKKRKLPKLSTDADQPDAKKGKDNVNWEMRKVSVPPHRYTPLKKNWSKLVAPIINELKMQIRYNLRTRNVEIRCPNADGNKTHLQKAADFVQAFLLGFTIEDAVALILKTLRGDHLSRAIGRIAGKDGRVKTTIESVTQTRIVLADDKIHLLGAFNNLKIARHTICSLIMGTPINKIHGNLRSLASRLAEQL
uniref:K Homology domain-containing protein n=1 Tax=Meloidogyne javanica TaxID=6303 RepID=A0A915MQ82_MELJA